MYHERMVSSLQVVLTGKRFSAKVCSANGPRLADPVARMALTSSWDISPEQKIAMEILSRRKRQIGYWLSYYFERGVPGGNSYRGGQANTRAFVPRPTIRRLE